MNLIGAVSMVASPKFPETGCRYFTAGGAWSDQVAAHEFYEHADEHFAWAETAKTERERAIFLQMAAAWLEVAQQWEAGNPPESSVRVRPPRESTHV
jgi:hypothetical protein